MSKINKKLIDELYPTLKEALDGTEKLTAGQHPEKPYITLMTLYYTHVEGTGGRTIEKAVKDNLPCGFCRNNIKKYWKLRLEQYGY